MMSNEHDVQRPQDAAWDDKCLNAAQERLGRRLGDGKGRSERTAREETRLKFDRAVGGDLVELTFDDHVISEKPVR